MSTATSMTNTLARTELHHRAPTARTGREARRVNNRRGLGVAEMLIALGIAASVLTAVAYATDISFKAYSVTEEQANLMQRCRMGMHRVVSEIRIREAHQPVTASAVVTFNKGTVVSDTGIQMLDDAGRVSIYKYDAVKKELVHVDHLDNTHVLARGVENFSVKFEPMQSQNSLRTGGVFDVLMRATIMMQVKTHGQSADVDETVGTQIVTLSTSVMPRRNLW